MSEDDRQEAVAQLLEDLTSELRDAMRVIDRASEREESLTKKLDRAEDREKRLSQRVDEVHGLVSEVRRNQRDIKEIHRDLYGQDGLLGRVKMMENMPIVTTNGDGQEQGGVFVSTGSLVSIGIFVLSSALIGLWHLLEWIIQLAHRIGR